jgi:hypothetical protein
MIKRWLDNWNPWALRREIALLEDLLRQEAEWLSWRSLVTEENTANIVQFVEITCVPIVPNGKLQKLTKKIAYFAKNAVNYHRLNPVIIHNRR